MQNLHYVYQRSVMGELEHDALKAQAKRCGQESVKRYLDLVVGFEIDRCRREFMDGLTKAELQAYQNPQSEIESAPDDKDDEIPF